MGFLDFLAGATMIVLGYGALIFFGFGAILLFVQGENPFGAVFLILAFIGGVFAMYQRGRQERRI